MAPANLAPPNFSQTQRIVLLIDLHPLLSIQNPSSYFTAVTSAAECLLHFPPISASLSAFRLFFSSLSPLRSAAVLPRHLSSHSLSFNLPPQTLISLATTLNSLASLTDLPNSPCCSRATHVASSLIELIHDYAWETENDNLSGEDDFIDSAILKIPSNLVLLLSPIAQSVDNFVDYFEMREFGHVFGVVRDAFVIRDIHMCWIDVKNIEFENEGVGVKRNECSDNLACLRNGIRKMGWGFCSTDSIVLGSALLPLGLIYSEIGMSFDAVNIFGGIEKKKYIGELSLEILDVNEMPLECKWCDLEFVNLKTSPFSIKNNDISSDTRSKNPSTSHIQDGFWLSLGKTKAKILVKSVHKYNKYENIGGSSEIVLVREYFHKSSKNKTCSGDDDFFADKVLETLREESNGVPRRNQVPTWQIFLNFLHMNSYWAYVSLSSCNEDMSMGCLKPFSTNFAVLYISNADHIFVSDKTGTTRIENINDCHLSQTDTSTSSSNCVEYQDRKRTKGERNVYKNITWSSFRKLAVGGSIFDLFELYITNRYFGKSKKVKFFKCWMKQITKVGVEFRTTLLGSKSEEELADSLAFLSEPSLEKAETTHVLTSETLETFSNNLSKKIQHGLESGMDLQNLSERLVRSSVEWLRQNRATENDSASDQQQCMRFSDDSRDEVVVGEKLIELLLRSPKEMWIQHDSGSCSSGKIVREYEMQVFLRIEILRYDDSAVLGESEKRKLIKQICSLLEIIQYLVAGGIHGHVSLLDYVERTIRARYSDALEDVVKKIYDEMDLLPFGDEEQTPSLLFNSEDSKDKYDKNEKAETNSISQSFSTEGDSSQPPHTSTCDSPEKIRHEEYTQILNEARERRERARRFAPFVSKARDLQRVWAPKQLKPIKKKFDPITNKSKRKKDGGYYSSVVCETPMTGNKRACSRTRIDIDKSSYSVSKALFQDN